MTGQILRPAGASLPPWLSGTGEPHRKVLADAARWYRDHMGWDARVIRDEVRLRLGKGVVAFNVDGALASMTAGRLLEAGVDGPVVRIGHPSRSIFIMDANDSFWAQQEISPDVAFLRTPASVPLPPSLINGIPATWGTEPDPRQRWLPAAETVAQVIGSIVTSLPRQRPPSPGRR